MAKRITLNLRDAFVDVPKMESLRQALSLQVPAKRQPHFSASIRGEGKPLWLLGEMKVVCDPDQGELIRARLAKAGFKIR